jgi:hypothetical protein
MAEKKICPKCGKRSMVEKDLLDGRYELVCGICHESRGPLKRDAKKGVV